MRRREFIAGFAGAAAWPMVARAQQPKMPVVGVLMEGAVDRLSPALVAAFHRGLAESGYDEGRNVAIEWRIAPAGQLDQLLEFAADLVRRQVAVIATPGSTRAALAAKAATATIPIVFGEGLDPVQVGLVASFARPGGNATGFFEMSTIAGTKRFALLRELVPQAGRVGVLVDPSAPLFAESAIRDARAAAASLGGQIEVLTARTDREVDTVFASLQQKRIDVLAVAPHTLFYIFRNQLATLAARYAVPAIYWDRALVEAGGLISYGSSITDMFRQVGSYAGRILKGEKPAEMPVMQPTKFELIINLKTAKALGLVITPTMLALADEVIE